MHARDYSKRDNKPLWSSLRRSKFPYDWILIVDILLLLIAGLAFLASTLAAEGQNIFLQEFFFQLIFGVFLGTVIAFFISRIDYHILLKWAGLATNFTLWLLLFLGFFGLYSQVFNIPREEVASDFSFLPIKPYAANNSIRWITIESLPNFQPIELAKITLLLYFAKFLQEPGEEGYTFQNLKRPIYVFISVSILSLLQPDLGSVLLIFSILFSAMWSVKVPMKILSPLIAGVVIVGLTLTFSTSYRRDRIAAFSDPTSASSYQINQAKLAITNGGIWGQGYSYGQIKQSGTIPEATTDAIIAVISEELGIIRTILFLFLYLLFIFRGLKIAADSPDPAGKALATGISVWIGLQTFINIMGITGLIPLKGIPLPFISSGGSSMLISLIAFGILLSVDRTNKLGTNLKNRQFFG